MSDTQDTAGPADTYRTRASRFTAERDRLQGRASVLSNLRIAAFALLVAVGLLIERRPGVLPIALGAAVFAVFVALVVAHRRARERAEWHADLAAFNEQGLHRLARDWDRLPIQRPPLEPAAHAYAGDLDLFGRASLTQILGPVGSVGGVTTLGRWLLGRAQPDVVRARQEAVRELAPRHELRESLALHARRTATVRPDDLERFLTWAESSERLGGRLTLRLTAWLLPASLWLLILLHATGVITRALWLLPLAVGLALYFTLGARTRAIFDAAFGREAMFAHYPDMITVITTATFRAPLLRALADRLVQDGAPADRRIDRLHRLMHLADLRLSSMHLPVFLATMWDLHLLRALEQWQRTAGGHARDWIAALGEVETLAALATLTHDEPEWCFAELKPHDDAVIEAESLGHPLLRGDERVTNDVCVGPPGTFLLVTGSNMSGKSTLLRALGANAVLAQAGGPSCARLLRMPPLEVYTSIRVQDSLARGVSYFMAELERLKQVVDAADRAAASGTATLLFLLDEILHGTNTAERRIAASRVISHLVDVGAIGAATTHDLALAEEPTLARAAQLVHFEEHFVDVDGESVLRFDYRLRQGIATSTNALELMRLVGLPSG